MTPLEARLCGALVALSLLTARLQAVLEAHHGPDVVVAGDCGICAGEVCAMQAEIDQVMAEIAGILERP